MSHLSKTRSPATIVRDALYQGLTLKIRDADHKNQTIKRPAHGVAPIAQGHVFPGHGSETAISFFGGPQCLLCQKQNHEMFPKVKIRAWGCLGCAALVATMVAPSLHLTTFGHTAFIARPNPRILIRTCGCINVDAVLTESVIIFLIISNSFISGELGDSECQTIAILRQEQKR